MAKKNFTDSLIGNNRSKKLDMLVSKPAAEVEAQPAPTATPASKPVAKKASQPKVEEKQKAVKTAKETTPAANESAPKKRGRKKKDIERDSFFYTVEKEFLFQIKAAAFWDRRDISAFITRAIKHYMDEEMGESEMRRAVREFKSRLEEQK